MQATTSSGGKAFRANGTPTSQELNNEKVSSTNQRKKKQPRNPTNKLNQKQQTNGNQIDKALPPLQENSSSEPPSNYKFVSLHERIFN